MSKELTRREWIARGSAFIGGAVTMGAMQGGCSSSQAVAADAPDSGTPDSGTPDGGTSTQALVKDFPYEKFVPAGYALDAAKAKEDSYQAYWVAGCCHGVYAAIMDQFAKDVGEPFDLLPLNIGAFGGGGIAGYGSICGAILGGLLAQNNIVKDGTARAAMMTDLMRWYEGNAFPAYVPTTINAAETGTTLDFSAGHIAALQVIPQNHLCHASRTQWSVANHVAANSKDLSARCGRLTADVAGKVVAQLNSYLSSRAFTAAPLDTASAACLTCHAPSTTSRPVASGMKCNSCHPDKASNHP